MKLAIVCNDTRGGVQPYAALALGLRAVGFDVRAICPAHSTSLFTENGIRVAEQFGTTEEFIEASRRVAESGAIDKLRFHLTEMPHRQRFWQQQTLQGCEGTEAILSGIGGMSVGAFAARRLGIPFIQMQLHPIFAPSRNYPGVLAPPVASKLGHVGNLAGHYFSDAMISAMLGGGVKQASDFPIFYGFSRRIVPIESSPTQERIANGYWTLKQNDSWSPSEELENFLSKSDDVVCIGFGSMVSKNPEEFYSDLIGAVKQNHARALVLTGWNGNVEHRDDDDVLFATDIPHHWLLDKVRAIIHHGGAGTTGAAFTAGKPQLVIPFGMDQPFWGTRVYELGVGPRSIERSKVTASNIAASIKTMLTDSRMADSAEKLGSELRSETGVESTAEQLKNLLFRER